MRYVRSFLMAVSLAVAVVTAAAAQAEPLLPPIGDVVLTINGQMAQTNAASAALFDLDMLRGIGAVTFSTSTPWTVGVQDFTGVPLNQLLSRIGANPANLKISAINEYEVEVPASDAVNDGPILAWAQNGKLLSLREKGPLWLIYPFDSKKEYQTEEIQARAVWQVVQIDLLP